MSRPTEIHRVPMHRDVTSLCSAHCAAGNRPGEPLWGSSYGAKMEKGI